MIHAAAIAPETRDGDTVAAASAAVQVSEADFPVAALVDNDMALAIIVSVEGTSYRPVGAAMAIDAQGRCKGSLSSGCIDEDVALHAKRAMVCGQSVVLRYGAGSPFLDLSLPCGGGLDILIIPRPDAVLMQDTRDRLRGRNATRIRISEDGVLSTALQGSGLLLDIVPEIRFLVFGSGPEAETFASIADMTGYQTTLFSPQVAIAAGFRHPLTSSGWPRELTVDPWTAVTLFFHDHSWEPALLEAALRSKAFYVGAQGSLRARQQRIDALYARGLDEEQVNRMAVPFGIVPSARDPRTLAVSVLADVLSTRRSITPYVS